MDSTISDWLGLALRWAHAITGIAWIGSSFYFMWLDSHLRKPDPPRERVEGEIWMVHSGGFYATEKRLLRPGEVPGELHWFKWEAAFSLITGLLLLVVVYYLSAGVFMVAPDKMDLEPWAAIAIGVATLTVGWLIYDGLWISPLASHERWLSLVCFLLLVGLAYGLGEIISGRAAYMHVGALMGTVMAVNVWVRILPAQTAMIAAIDAGREADWSRGLVAKQRSVHNNYMTLPVVFVMLSSHYPGTYGHRHGWAILAGLFVVGAGVRHWFNLKNAGKRNHWLIPAAVAGMLVLAWFSSQTGAPAGGGEPVAFTQVRAIINQHCVSCHSVAPTDENFKTAPKNVKFDTPGEIRTNALRIKAQAAVSRAMPLGNVTEMEDVERDLIARWVNQGAPID